MDKIVKTGIKFCGGCNPRYDRGAYADRLIKSLEKPAELAVPGKAYDTVYVICGCQVCCADLSSLLARRFVYITENGAVRDEIAGGLA
ncbi:hypothetical protein [Pseudoramibacter sp.]|jgi:fructose-1,6-bisphosphatase|uniref:hypothetical protein n=1 Tax=Pseudoramibacter sp. TaxID=2034862 RepID=UPI0025F83E56|nr:hypothetical protein [Pseudoramibacter sp.]MCH4072110.1 hypothetical protein [Pseudoramibacter sp.]MCH4105880.1 hypothetical protein [Pseudoramibacter sp.]